MQPVAQSEAEWPQRRFTVDEYYRLAEAGILAEDERVELIEGVIVEMTPQGRSHAVVIGNLIPLLVRAIGDELKLRVQQPLTLGDRSEPEPDLAVVSSREIREARRHPRTALLVIEVSDASHRRDRDLKARVYAAAGIPEYWIVDVTARSVELLSDPDITNGVYRASSTIDEAGVVRSRALPSVEIQTAELFDAL